ncbi:hypothetical protein DFH11DRAFT_1736791 [Phellopilus nigrolimitatus]|nr:hypothetical protein DFH11DRAFT_1736791 [Phellopilus nigrolimitatus]
MLVHFLAQLADKHLRYVPQEEWPGPLKPRNAQSMAYHTLTVLISYQTIFDAPKRQVLIEVFQAGLKFVS